LFLLRFALGDPAAIIAGEDATVEQIAAVRSKLGLDQPVLTRFVTWLSGILQGDLRMWRNRHKIKRFVSR
jgi:peptide/nickel transport system permease protein